MFFRAPVWGRKKVVKRIKNILVSYVLRHFGGINNMLFSYVLRHFGGWLFVVVWYIFFARGPGFLLFPLVFS